MKTPAVRLASTLALLALACLLASCNTKPENSEAFLNLRKDVRTVETGLESTENKIQSNLDEIDAVTSRVRVLEEKPVGSIVPAPAGAASPRTLADIKALQANVLSLQTQLTDTLKKQKAFKFYSWFV